MAAERRPDVPPATKLLLRDEAGGKCANPGCSNVITENHHIKQWHVYKAHDSDHMIAICGACHNAVHRGDLHITDDDLYRWKEVQPGTPSRAHLYVTPGAPPRLFMGAFVLPGDSGLIVFEFSPRLGLSFGVHDGEIMLLNLKLSNQEGELLIDVAEGHVRKHDPTVEMRQRPGRVQVPIKLTSGLLPDWLINPMLVNDPLFGIHELNLLDLEVMEPALVRVEGIWMDTDGAVVITRDGVSFIDRAPPRCVTMRGGGMDTVIQYVGPVARSLFNRLSN